MIPPKARGRWLRIAVFFAVLVGTVITAKVMGWTDHITLESVRNTISGAGLWGYGLYILMFAGGLMIQVPGMVFVVAAILVYGPFSGAVAAWAGALIGLSAGFLLVRAIGGSALQDINNERLQKLLQRLDQYPLRTVVLIRLLFFLFPPVNYALALTNLRFGTYLLGSAIGLVIPVVGMTMAIDIVIGWLGV